MSLTQLACRSSSDGTIEGVARSALRPCPLSVLMILFFSFSALAQVDSKTFGGISWGDTCEKVPGLVKIHENPLVPPKDLLEAISEGQLPPQGLKQDSLIAMYTRPNQKVTVSGKEFSGNVQRPAIDETAWDRLEAAAQTPEELESTKHLRRELEGSVDLMGEPPAGVTYYFWKGHFFQGRIGWYPSQEGFYEFKKALSSMYGNPISKNASEDVYRWDVRNRLVIFLVKNHDEDGQATLTVGSVRHYWQYVEEEKVDDWRKGGVFQYSAPQYGDFHKYGYQRSTLKHVKKDVVQARFLSEDVLVIPLEYFIATVLDRPPTLGGPSGTTQVNCKQRTYHKANCGDWFDCLEMKVGIGWEPLRAMSEEIFESICKQEKTP
jgi:hypothetical protein